MNEIQGNLSELKSSISDGYKRIVNLKEEREACNDGIQAIRSDLEAKGILKKALDWAIQYMNWDEDKRDGFDIAYNVVREALGAPMQDSMFTADGDVKVGSENE